MTRYVHKDREGGQWTYSEGALVVVVLQEGTVDCISQSSHLLFAYYWGEGVAKRINVAQRGKVAGWSRH